MKKILLAITLLLALPVLATAQEAMPKEHHMQNTSSSPAEPQEQAQEQAPPAHVMRNSNPAPKQTQEQDKEQERAPEHTMKNN